MNQTDAIEELEQRIIERVQFWDGYIDMLIRLRNSGVQAADRSSEWKSHPAEKMLRDGLHQAIDAALLLQHDELAQCLMLAGVGGKRATEYARERARKILGEDAMEFASIMGWVPTYWANKK